MPATGQEVPIGHGAQTEAPAALKVPGGQILGEVAPPVVMYPAGVVINVLLPISGTKEPGGAAVQLLRCFAPTLG